MKRDSRVAVVACRAVPDGSPTDLYGDADRGILLSGLAERHIEGVAVAWDDEGVDWADFDAAIVRSTWDSVDRPAEYLQWARATAPVTRLINPLPTIEWNLDKAYLQELAHHGLPVVPTTWVTDENEWRPPNQEFVVKPSVSGGGRETARYQPGETERATAHVRRILTGGRRAMVQPYISGVDADGEAKLVFLDGEFSHGVRVGPLLEPDSGGSDRPWEKTVTTTSMHPSRAELELADAVLAAAEAATGHPPLYARVDLMPGHLGDPLLSELELIDPSLFLCLRPVAAHRLCGLIDRIVREPRP
jgi:hypothetical protein